MSQAATISRIRPAAVAGQFYPRDADVLRRTVEELLAQAPPPGERVPKALIAPHAGYIYSGPIAASAFSQLIPARGLIQRVVLLGPAHFVAVHGLAATSAEAFATPLGRVLVDLAAMRQVSLLPQVKVLDAAHAEEHSLEVQLPFLQVVLREFTLVPLLIGEASPEQVSQVLDALWGGPETCLVISSDLSHYYSWHTARRLDGATAQAIEGLQPERIRPNQACGHIGVQGLLQAGRQHGLHAHTLDLRNSGDTAGPREQVVGYGAFGFEALA
ncbi:MAG TPA: AmmeMemoRadiSam system protein B [Candidatus Sulfotelmatobacter sp.]|nr:AmmeMemoRadiSam system protein B [Candidatus Sulfotelmatobacter sp.]HWI58131.1 AmmeMemoRadiSam system protein B [Bacillota bacterium]